MYVKLTFSSSSTTSNVSRFFLKSRRVILGLNGNIYVKYVEMENISHDWRVKAQLLVSVSVTLTKKRDQFCWIPQKQGFRLVWVPEHILLHLVPAHQYRAFLHSSLTLSSHKYITQVFLSRYNKYTTVQMFGVGMIVCNVFCSFIVERIRIIHQAFHVLHTNHIMP